MDPRTGNKRLVNLIDKHSKSDTSNFVIDSVSNFSSHCLNIVRNEKKRKFRDLHATLNVHFAVCQSNIVRRQTIKKNEYRKWYQLTIYFC